MPFVCAANKGSQLTFEFRLYPDGAGPGSIDPGHLGPCAVYIKKVNDMFTDSTAGPGWFKIWEDGYDKESKQWCVDRLVANNGLLSVNLPKGLPAGYYLVRPEILALHWAAHRNDPQFFAGCAQIFVNTDVQGPLGVPEEHLVSIPGYVNLSLPGLTFDVYQSDLPPYPMPGPKVFIPSAPDPSQTLPLPQGVPLVQTAGLVPHDCLLKSANWCGRPLPPSKDSDSCWLTVKTCFAQSKECQKNAPPVGLKNCDIWGAYCEQINQACKRNEFIGPPPFVGQEKVAPVPGELPAVWNNVFEEPEKTTA